jgi:hypothetical protein
MSEDWSEDFETTWLEPADLKTLLGLFLHDRGDQGGTEDELYQIYEWGEESRMSQYLMECCLDGLLIPTFKNEELAFKITDKGHKMALEALEGDMVEPKDRFIATKVLEYETGMSLRHDRKGDNDGES